MYQFSRSIYRELAPRVADDPADPTDSANRQHLLDACEATMQRLAYDRAYFARPAAKLFADVRCLFSLRDQFFVRRVIERHVALALECLEQMPAALGIEDQPRRCPAFNRRGTPCQREPAPNSEYCPSHRHLEEDLPIARPAPGELAVG